MYLEDIFTVPANLAGIPGLSLPCGLAGGLPVGLQLLGRPFDETTLLRCGAAIAACLAMVLLTHWVCERRLTNWTRPVCSRPRPQQDISVLEELGWDMDASRLIRLSRQFGPERSRGAGQVRFELQQLLNESSPAHLDEPRGDPPNGQSRHHRIDYATGNA